MREALSIRFDQTAVDEWIDSLAVGAQEATRPAAQAGAQVLYDEVKLNVGKVGVKTGNLASSIYQVFSADNSTPVRATYHVSWNASKAPHGHLVEFGHLQTRKAYIGSDGNWYTSKTLLAQPRQVGARPFVRPAFDSKAQAALQAANERWAQDMRAVIAGGKR